MTRRQGGCLSHLIRNLVVLLSLSGAALLHAQNSGLNFLPNTLQVSAQGKFEAEPDTAVITLTLSDQQSKRELAYNTVSHAAEQLRALLRQYNIDPKQMKVSSYIVNPVRDWRASKQRIIAFQVHTTATLKTRDFDQAGRIISAMSELPQASDQNLSYTLEDMDIAKQRAISDAYEKARTYADTVAKASKRAVAELVYATVDTQSMQAPRPMYATTMEVQNKNAAPAPTQDLGQETVTVTAQVNAIFRLQ